MIDPTGTAVGGINGVTAGNEYWRSSTATWTAGTSKVLGVVGTAYNAASNGNDVIDGIFTGQAVYEKYEAELVPNIRYQDTKSANAGFTSLMLKQAPIYWDRDCDGRRVYGLNSKYIALVGHTDRWFKQSPFSDGLSAAAGGNATTVDAAVLADHHVRQPDGVEQGGALRRDGC